MGKREGSDGMSEKGCGSSGGMAGSGPADDSEIRATDFQSAQPESTETAESALVRETYEALPAYGTKGRMLPGLNESLRLRESGNVRLNDTDSMLMERGAVAELVQGPDDRVMIADTMVAPYQTICHLLIQFPSGTFLGTGTFVNRNTILTAGHNLYDPARREWALGVTVTPAKNGSHNPMTPIRAPRSTMRTTQGWLRGLQVADVGAIRFPHDVTRRFLGIRSFEASEEEELRGLTIGVVGYPGSKDHPDPSRPNTMWGHARRVARIEQHRFFYDTDTTGGQSGSALIYANDAGRFYCVGIHNYGSRPFNIATRISEPLFDIIESWIEGT